MNLKKIMLCLLLLITITGLIVPATAVSYDGFYAFVHIYKHGKEVPNKIKYYGGIGLIKSKNSKKDYYTTKKNWKKRLNKVSKIVIKIKQNGKTKILKVITKPKNGWKLIFYPQYKYKNGKKVKTGKYVTRIDFKFNYKGKINNKKDKGSIYAYNSKGKLIYKNTNFYIMDGYDYEG